MIYTKDPVRNTYLKKYDSFRFTNKPSTEDLGLSEITVAFNKEVVIDGDESDYATARVDYDKLDTHIANANISGTLVYDLEQWEPGDSRIQDITDYTFGKTPYYGMWGSQARWPSVLAKLDFATLAFYPNYTQEETWRTNAQDTLQPLLDEIGKDTLIWVRPDYSPNVSGSATPLSLTPDSYWWLCKSFFAYYPSLQLKGLIYWSANVLDYPTGLSINDR